MAACFSALVIPLYSLYVEYYFFMMFRLFDDFLSSSNLTSAGGGTAIYLLFILKFALFKGGVWSLFGSRWSVDLETELDSPSIFLMFLNLLQSS